MSKIKISSLHSPGSELFQDSETFLNELTDQELGMLQGSGKFVVTSVVTNVNATSVLTVLSQLTISQGNSIASASQVSFG